VVDDEPDIVFVTKARIRPSGYDVAEAFDGESALARITELRPDLVMLDLKMPKLNGYQVCKTVKADPNLRDTLIVVCSAVSSLGLAPEKCCLEIGADGYVRKPYDVRKMLEEISRLLARKKEIAAGGS
jgi:CheY-like chemotaxis protein